jgi:MraZ protein
VGARGVWRRAEAFGRLHLAEAEPNEMRTTVFVGRHERQLDPKGRLALPSNFRPQFEPRCYLSFGQEGCIDVLPATTLEEVAEELMNQVKRGEITRAERRSVSSNMVEAGVDSQGRITVDKDLREFAGLDLGTGVIIAGSFDRVEIWNAARYAEQNAIGSAYIKHIDSVNGKEDPRSQS